MEPLANPYATAPRFDELAVAVPAFATYVRTTSKGQPTIDFQDEKAVRALTAALLERDFQLKISLPDDRLCPMVPGRFEYMLWILRLALRTLNPSPSPLKMTALDIGTGSSAIYPLLGCRSFPSLRFVATDVDEHSLTYARQNVLTNALNDRVDVRKVGNRDGLFPDGEFDFTMCNPPFYSSAEEVATSLAAKELEPYAVCTGGTTEMITEGGEVVFVGRMVKESLQCGERIRWFSSLLGKYSSVGSIVAQLKAESIENYTITELTHGQTKRYLMAWSLQAVRLPSSVYHPPASAYSNPAIATHLLPPSNAHTYYCPPSLSTVEEVQKVLSEVVEGIDGSELLWFETGNGALRASKNGWSRSARRGVMKEGVAMEVEVEVEGDTTPPLLGARFEVKMEGQQVKVVAEWIWGLDRARKDWSGLWAFLIRKLGDRAKAMEVDTGEQMVEG